MVQRKIWGKSMAYHLVLALQIITHHQIILMACLIYAARLKTVAVENLNTGNFNKFGYIHATSSLGLHCLAAPDRTMGVDPVVELKC